MLQRWFFGTKAAAKRLAIRSGSDRRARAVGILLIGCSLSTACGSPTEPDLLRETTFFVASQRVPCVGAFPQSCLRVRESTQAEWELFYDSISGFSFEPAFEYELRVRIYRVPNPPADGSSVRYELVRQVRKTSATT